MTTREDENSIGRREAIRRVSAMLGGVAFVGGSALLTACENESAPGAAGAGPFTPADVAFLDEVAETILPETKTPGAKAAKTGAFMARMVTDCYEDADQKIFRRGMQQLDEASQKAANAPFMSASPEARTALLQSLDREQKAYMVKKKHNEPSHYFRMMKELALLGYFTSEIGYTQAMRYAESPGRFDPCVPYKAGETSWASHA
jgi:hypothetical protein